MNGARRERGWLLLAALLAASNLVFGLGGALVRIGSIGLHAAGPAGGHAVALHGATMVCGFFGTLIALERAVALHRGYGVPVIAGAGGVVGWAAGAASLALAIWIVAALALLALYLHAGHARAWSLHLVVEATGALALALGSAAMLAGRRDAALIGWCAFLVLTIAGERRELTRMVRLPRWAQQAFIAVVGVLVVALASSYSGAVSAGTALWWAGCAALGAWLLRFDIAPRRWREAGWHGHTAQALSVGYGWLIAAALTGLAEQRIDGVALHLLLLGFVFAMVFGHAPIILPALARLRPAYRPLARLPLWLMAVSLALRWAGAHLPAPTLLPVAGAGHALAIVLFALVMARCAWVGTRARS